MRHRIGIILAAIMTGVLFFPGAWGYLRLLRLPVPGDQLSGLPAGGGSLISDHHALLALAALAGAFVLAAVLIGVPWISPLAAGLPGLLLLAWTALYLVSVRQAVDLIPLRADPFGAGFEAMLFDGILGAGGLAMIVPMFVPSRWRAYRADEIEAAAGLEVQAMRAQTVTVPGEATAESAPVDQPTTQLTPIRVSGLAPLPAPPWHEGRDPSGS
jgi:hypothetical protein